jgi:hypothetical protein
MKPALHSERQFDTGSPFSIDCALLLTMGEAAIPDDPGWKAFAKDACSPMARVVEAMNYLEAWHHCAKWVIVESYEWEPG